MAEGKKIKVRDHQLSTVLPSVWKQLKKENAIDDVYRFRVKKFEFRSSFFQLAFWMQKKLFDKKVRKIDFSEHPPVFILGLWRSGTTHLHYAMARDPQFGYLNNHQAFTFNMSLLSGNKLNKIFNIFVPGRRPQDNVKLSLDEPAEEEQPFSTTTTRSAIHSFFFPRNQSYFRKYHLFEGVDEKELKAWQKDYKFLVQNIAYYSGKEKLLLKNPHSTGRVKELLALFPNAKFIFIHRDPEIVFHSTQRLYKLTVSSQFLQQIAEHEIDEVILENNKLILEKYFKERSLIPEGNLIEVSYASLEKRPWETIQEIYSHLGLSGLDRAEPEIRKYLHSVKGYEKNRYSDLSRETKERVKKEWAPWYREWAYE